MSLGLNRTNFRFIEDIDLYEIKNNLGFNLGVLMDYQISNHFTISPKAELAFYESSTFINAIDTDIKMELVMLDLTTQIKYSLKENKKGLYLIAGPKVQIPLGKKLQISTVFNFPINYTMDIGAGFNLNLKHYQFSPEIKYSFGLRSIHPNPSIPLSKFNSLSLVFNFLG